MSFCAVHAADESIASCASCRTDMCDACFRFLQGRKPICVRCAHEVTTRSRRAVSLGVFMALTSIAGAWWFLHVSHGKDALLIPVLVLACASFVVGIALSIRALRSQQPIDTITRRIAGADWNTSLASNRDQQRARTRRVVAKLTPTLSGRSTALVTLVTMALTAGLFPWAMHQPRWVEIEIVIAAWWLLAVVASSVLLYRGYHVEDDHYFQAPSNVAPDVLNATNYGDFGCDPGFGTDGCEGVLGTLALAVVVVIATLFAIVVAWLMVELVAPLIFVAFYVVTLSAIRRISRDRHDCSRNIQRSLRWAVTWSTLYVAPIAATVWLVHALLR